MKYQDQQPAAIGDTFIAGTWGQCTIAAIDAYAHIATVRNVNTGELFELDSLAAADLTGRPGLD
jgi:hypothetical protein